MAQNYCLDYHSWHGFTENGPRRNITQPLKLFSYITLKILKISFKNYVSSLLSTHYRTYMPVLFDQSPEPLIPLKNR